MVPSHSAAPVIMALHEIIVAIPIFDLADPGVGMFGAIVARRFGLGINWLGLDRLRLFRLGRRWERRFDVRRILRIDTVAVPAIAYRGVR